MAGVRGEAERILPPEPGLVPSVAGLCGNQSRPSQGVMQPRNGYSVRGTRPKEACVATIQGICSVLVTGVLLTAPALALTTGPNGAAGAPSGTSSPTVSATGDRDSDAGSIYVTADGKLRAGKMVGATVYNDQNQSIGSIDDVLWDPSDKAATVIISVGGFLGLGAKLVSVPYDRLKFDNKVLLAPSDQLKLQKDRIVLPGATQASLKGLPDFHYGSA